jgi:hypothetical protein
LNKRPEKRAQVALGTKLRKLKGPVCVMIHPIKPPNDTAVVPRYGPRMSPINGAITVAIVMNFPTAPITGNNETNERTACTEAKQQTKAKFLVSNSELDALLTFSFVGSSE